MLNLDHRRTLMVCELGGSADFFSHVLSESLKHPTLLSIARAAPSGGVLLLYRLTRNVQGLADHGPRPTEVDRTIHQLTLHLVGESAQGKDRPESIAWFQFIDSHIHQRNFSCRPGRLSTKVADGYRELCNPSPTTAKYVTAV